MFLNEELKISASVGATTHTLIYKPNSEIRIIISVSIELCQFRLVLRILEWRASHAT
jgi:hypothetical protein